MVSNIFRPEEEELYFSLPDDAKMQYVKLRKEILEEREAAQSHGFSFQKQYFFHSEKDRILDSVKKEKKMSQKDRAIYEKIIDYYLCVSPRKALDTERNLNQIFCELKDTESHAEKYKLIKEHDKEHNKILSDEKFSTLLAVPSFAILIMAFENALDLVGSGFFELSFSGSVIAVLLFGLLYLFVNMAFELMKMPIRSMLESYERQWPAWVLSILMFIAIYFAAAYF